MVEREIGYIKGEEIEIDLINFLLQSGYRPRVFRSYQSSRLLEFCRNLGEEGYPRFHLMVLLGKQLYSSLTNLHFDTSPHQFVRDQETKNLILAEIERLMKLLATNETWAAKFLISQFRDKDNLLGYRIAKNHLVKIILERIGRFPANIERPRRNLNKKHAERHDKYGKLKRRKAKERLIWEERLSLVDEA